MKYKIEHGVDVPEGHHLTPKECPYPFADMRVGDSFAVECSLTYPDYQREYAKVLNWAAKFRKRNLDRRHFHIMTRKTETGFRVWRTE